MLAKDQRLNKVIINFKKALTKQGIKADRIILFGSQAQGTASENSDIDVVVISSNFKGLNFMQRCEILGRASNKVI